MYIAKTETTKSAPHHLFILLIVLMLMLSLLQLILANHLATQGRTMAKIEEQVSILEEENLELQNQKAKIASIGRIVQESQRLGFYKPDSFLYISPQTPVALAN